jgi:hypothetical protein
LRNWGDHGCPQISQISITKKEHLSMYVRAVLATAAQQTIIG